MQNMIRVVYILYNIMINKCAKKISTQHKKTNMTRLDLLSKIGIE